MRKSLGTYFCHYFKMPHLQRKDLTAIEGILKKDLKPEGYHIAFDGVEYDSVKDIDSDKSSTNVFVIYTQQPSIRLKLSRSWAELYCGEADDELQEAGKKIASIVHRGERKNLWIFSKYSNRMAPVIGFGGAAITVGEIYLGNWPVQTLYGTIALLVACTIWWAIGYRYSVSAFCRVDFR